MEILSNKTIIEQEIGNVKDSDIFFAEKIIIKYIGKIPENWDTTLTLATARLIERLSLDNGVKHENTDGHSVTYADMSDIKNLLGASILAILDEYCTEEKIDDKRNFYNYL